MPLQMLQGNASQWRLASVTLFCNVADVSVCVIYFDGQICPLATIDVCVQVS